MPLLIHVDIALFSPCLCWWYYFSPNTLFFSDYFQDVYTPLLCLPLEEMSFSLFSLTFSAILAFLAAYFHDVIGHRDRAFTSSLSFLPPMIYIFTSSSFSSRWFSLIRFHIISLSFIDTQPSFLLLTLYFLPLTEWISFSLPYISLITTRNRFSAFIIYAHHFSPYIRRHYYFRYWWRLMPATILID